MAVSFRPEDRAFVQIAIDECTILNLPKYSPTGLIWNSRLPVDQPFLHQSYLMMPEALNGKITPQEARPLIMSAIFQKNRVRRSYPPDRHDALPVILGTAGLIGGILGSISIGKALGVASLGENIAGGILLTWVAQLFIVGGLRRTRRTRVERLESDVQVARLIGSETLLETLRKIDNLNLTPQSSRIRLLMSEWPTLSQRISTLEKSSLPTTEKDAFEAFQKKWS